MPEYFPPTNRYEGLAQEALRLAAMRGQYSPWAALAQAAGSMAQGWAQGQQARRAAAGPTLTPEQAVAAGFPSTYGPKGAEKPVAGAFPRGVPTSIVESYNKRREQEALSKETTERVLGAAKERTAKDQMEVTQEMLDTDQKLKGHGLHPGTYPTSYITSISKSSPGADQNLTQEERNALMQAMLREKNPLPPSLIKSRGAEAKVMANTLMKDPDWSPNPAEAGLAGAKSGAAKAETVKSDIETNLNSAHEALMGVLDQAAPLAGKSTVGLVNQFVTGAKKELNTPEAIKLYAYLDQAAGNYGRITKGGSASITDEDKKNALRILTTKLNEGGIQAVQEAVETEYKGRLEGINKKPREHTKQAPKQPGATKAGAGSLDDILKKHGVQ